MAIGVVNVTATASATDAVSYAMPAANYEKDSLILFSIVNSKGTSPDAAVIAGLVGATWEAIETVSFTVPIVTRHTVWRTMVGTSQNTITLTASFGGATQTGFVGIVDLVTGCATSGNNGSGAIAQSTWTTTEAAGTITISLPGVPTDAVFGAFSKQLNTAMGTPSGFTETGDLGQATPARRAMSAFNLTAAQTFASTQPAVATLGAIAMEFKAQTSGAAGGVRKTLRLLTGVGV